MPFTGGNYQGAIDPSMVQMVFDQRRQREEARQKAAQAQMEAQIAFMEQQRKDAAEAAKEKRAQEKHDWEKRAAQSKHLGDQAAAFAGLHEQLTAAGVSPDLLKAHQAQLISRMVSPDNLFTDPSNTEVDPATGGDFASVMGQLDPGMVQRDAGQIDAANQQYQSNPTGTLFDSDLQRLAFPGESAADTLARVGVQGEAGRLAEAAAVAKERDKARFDSDLTYSRTDRLNRESENRAHMKKPKDIIAMDDEINRLGRIANDPSNPPEVRAKAKSNQEALITTRDFNWSRSQPAEAFADRNAQSQHRDKYTGTWGTYQATRAIYMAARATGGATIGTQASVTEKLASVKGFIEDATKMPFGNYLTMVAQDQINRALAEGDTETASRIQHDIMSPDVLRQIAEGHLTELELNFAAAAVNSPHNRITNAMMEKFGKTTNFMGLANPSNRAFATMEANLNKQQRELQRLRQNMDSDYPGRFNFDPKTGELLAPNKLSASGDLNFGEVGGSYDPNTGAPQVMPPEAVNPVIERMKKKAGKK